MPSHPAAQALVALIVFTCAFALWKGGKSERLAALIVLLNFIGGLVGSQFIPGYRGVASLTLDAATAFGFLALTLAYGLPWLGLAMLIFALQFGLHAFYFVTNRHPEDVLHATINNLNFLGVIICLAFGTIDAIRRRQTLPAA